MSALVIDSVGGLVRGIMSGTLAFFTVMLLSIVYKYFTNEKLSSFIGIVFGLGFLGFSGGLLAILDQPSVGGAIEVVVVSILIVWGVNTGDKIADKMPKKSASSILDSIRRNKSAYTTIKLPDERLIFDMAGKPKVIDSLKAELSLREFTLPADIPIDEIAKRVKRRLITDWGVGDVELELDQDGKVIHLAIAAKTVGLSGALPEDCLAVPIECQVIPSNLAPGDIVNIYMENDECIERCEVKGVDEEHRTITVCSNYSFLEKVRGKKASLVVALSSTSIQPYPTISVEQQSGEIEEFQFQRMLAHLKKAGISDETALNIVTKVQSKLDKMDPPISIDFIRKEIVKELKAENPEAAKKLRFG